MYIYTNIYTHIHVCIYINLLFTKFWIIFKDILANYLKITIMFKKESLRFGKMS